MGLMEEFFAMHRNGKGKSEHGQEREQGQSSPLNLDETLFHWSPDISFSITDVFKAGILCGELGKAKEMTAQSSRRKRRTKGNTRG
jgi:hypothetical protein